MADDKKPNYDPNPTRLGGATLKLSGDGKAPTGRGKGRPARDQDRKDGPAKDRSARDDTRDLRSAPRKPGDQRHGDRRPAGKGASNKKPGGGSSPKNASKDAHGKAKKPNFKAAIKSRQICLNILIAVDEGSQLDLVLNADEDLPTLEDRDRRFVRLLATTCLRRRGQLEAVISPMVPRRPFGPQEHANLIMLMGAAQLLILKTGPHAAVDSTVELMRQSGFERLTGMANAVMRRLTREGEKAFEKTSDADNLPAWLRTSWETHYGAEQTAAMCALAMQPPTLDISVKADAKKWAAALEGQLINATTIRREFDGDPSKLAGFADGAWWVQDAAAAVPAKLLGDIAGKDVIDLCAAPGGKTAQLIAAGANVTAVESARKRVDRLRRNLKRLGMKADLQLADGRKFVPDFPVDAVLLDAPCSATGTLRRRPDILANRTPEDITALQSVQWELATTALGWLKPGGHLVYATCSLQPEEGEAVIEAILKAGDGAVEISPITADEAGDFAASIRPDGTMRILPSDYANIGGVDGFYIARLKSQL